MNVYGRKLANFTQPQAEPSKDHQGQVSASLHVNHWWWKMPLKDPKVQLAAEFGPRVWRLQEQSPGVRTQALSQKGAQSDCQLRPHQLVDGKLASLYKAEAACHVKSQLLGISLPRLPFLKEHPFCQNLLGKFLWWTRNGTTRNNLQN